MELDGILKACIRKVVPKRARITVTRSDSSTSRMLRRMVRRTSTVGASGAASSATPSRTALGVVSIVIRSRCAFSLQMLQSGLRSSLLGVLLGGSFRLRHRPPPHSHLDLENLAVLRSAFFDYNVMRLRFLVGLQVLLQCRLIVGKGKGLNPFLQPVSQNKLVDEASRRIDPSVQEQSGNQRLQSIHQHGPLGTSAAAFLAASQLPVTTQVPF